MSYVLACVDFDAATGQCVAEEWVLLQGILPILPVAEGVELSGAMIAAVAVAWSLKAIRRYIWPKA